MTTYHSYSELKNALFNSQMTCESVVQTLLDEIEKNNDLNCFLETFDNVIDQAKAVDKKIKEGKAGKLAGMVIAVKDVINIKNQHASCASKMLENYVSVYNATVIERLLAEDAILIGRTNMDEFAMGSSNENSAFGVVRNPHDKTRVPGGSSGGSAVAVAAHLCSVSLGTDTGGSIRFPAAFCGVVGLKPTYGRVSRYGLTAYASSFDQIGPFGNSVADVALALEVLAGFDEKDSTSSRQTVEPYSELLDKPISGLKVGLPKEYFSEGLSEEVKNRIQQVADSLAKQGAELVDISLPHTNYCIATYYVLTTAEASSNLARFDGVRYTHRSTEAKSLSQLYIKSRSEGFGTEVKRRIMLGTYVLSAGYYDAYYGKAQKVRRLIREDFENAFKQCDVLLTPASTSTAFKIGAKTDNALEMYLNDIYTVSANLAGIPGISVPVGKASDGLPIGAQLLGNFFDEKTILNVASHIEKMKF